MTASDRSLPLKSVGVALLYTVILGPLGLLYASIRGSLVMLLAALVVISGHYWFLTLLVWIISCVWGVAAVESFNRNVVKG